MIILHCFFPCQMLFESFRAKSPDFAFDHWGFHFTVSLECSLEVEVLFLNQFVDVNLLFEFKGDNSDTLEREPHTIKIFEVCKSQTFSKDSVFCFSHGNCAISPSSFLISISIVTLSIWIDSKKTAIERLCLRKEKRKISPPTGFWLRSLEPKASASPISYAEKDIIIK